MLRIVWDACSTVCRTASAKLSGDRPDSSMNFTTDIVPSLIVRAGYGLPETAGMQLGAGVVRAQRHLRMVGSARKSPVTEGGAQRMRLKESRRETKKAPGTKPMRAGSREFRKELTLSFAVNSLPGDHAPCARPTFL